MFDALLNAQEAEIRAAKGPGDLDALLAGGETWQVA